MEIEKLMIQAGRTLKEYPGIELPESSEIKELGNKLLNEEINYNKEQQKEEHLKIFGTLNYEQCLAFDSIMESVGKYLGKQIFVEGYSGTGKTYLWKAITTKLRSEGKTVLAVASSGIVALLLQGRETITLEVPHVKQHCYGVKVVRQAQRKMVRLANRIGEIDEINILCNNILSLVYPLYSK